MSSPRPSSSARSTRTSHPLSAWEVFRFPLALGLLTGVGLVVCLGGRWRMGCAVVGDYSGADGGRRTRLLEARLRAAHVGRRLLRHLAPAARHTQEAKQGAQSHQAP